MRIEGLPRFSSEQIEGKASELLRYFSSDYFTRIQSTPLLSIVEFLKSKHNIVFQFDSTLGFNSDNNRILGACNLIKKVIIIDSSLKADVNKFNFTLAHELGHLALHRKVKFKYDMHDKDIDGDTVSDNFTNRELKSDSDWIEWQANYYASALLMPAEIFKAGLIFEQRKLGISKTGRIYVDNEHYSKTDYYQLISLLSERFVVSKSAVEYRLRKLNLIDDRRKEFKSFGDFLSGTDYSL